MKFLILALAVACAQARPDVSHFTPQNAEVPIVKSDFEITPEGGFRYAYETGNGIYGEAQGQVKNLNSEYPAQEITGRFKYTSPEGEVIEQTYVADENGFQPQGSHVPTPPPIPEAIARSLQYIAQNAPKTATTYAAAPANAFGSKSSPFAAALG